MSKIIVAGTILHEAAAWLCQHGAVIEQALGLQHIILPSDLTIESGASPWVATITAKDEDGQELPAYAIIEVDPDVTQSRVRLATLPSFQGGCNTDLSDPGVQVMLLGQVARLNQEAQDDARFLDMMRDSD